MREVPIAEFIDNFAEIADYVLLAPVAITKDARVKFVLISAEEYKRLARLDSEGGAQSA